MKRLMLIALATAMCGGLLLCGIGRIGSTVELAYAKSAPAPSTGKIDFESIFHHAQGGNIAPCRIIFDPYPEFNGIALDLQHNLVAMSDTNLKSLLVYNLSQGSADSSQITPQIQQVKGPATYISYAAGVAFDPARRMMCVTENDVGDDIACFPDNANGDYKAQVLAVPHGSYGIGFSQRLKEMALSIEHNEQIIFYRTGATGAELPLRAIRGIHTRMADPHGLFWDDKNHEVGVTNHGNWSRAYWDIDYNGGGHYQPPSITIFADTAKGDVKPLREIAGDNTQLNWPSGIAVDDVHNEIAVANTAGTSVLIFSRTANGNVKPLRVIEGPHTGLTVPMGVAFDPIHNTLWVANFGHTALVFSRTANGDATPLRIVRNAPAGTEAVRFGNPFTIAYDSKRDQLIVPNCVTDPRVAAFARLASGDAEPVTMIYGTASKLTRVAHGVTYDPGRDEILGSEPLASSVIGFKGGSNGQVPPIQVIQGPHTRLHQPWGVQVDDVHHELVVGDYAASNILVYPWDANGDVAPLRVIGGVNTMMRGISDIAVDPQDNLIIAVTSQSRTSAASGAGVYTANYETAQTEHHGGIFMFDRLANGNVKPKRVIMGPHTGILNSSQVQVWGGRIFATVSNTAYQPPYDLAGDRPRPGCTGPPLPPLTMGNSNNFIGVWKITDNGDVPPEFVIHGPATQMVSPAGIAINPQRGEIYVTDGGVGATFTFLVPQAF